MKKVYFAGPWFTAEQEERHTRLYNILSANNNLDIFNPKLESNITNQKDNDKFDEVLLKNIKGIVTADIIIAITDGKDMGTIWETGFAYANKKPIIYYCETIGDKPFNLMLAKTGKVAKNIYELMLLLEQENSYIWQISHQYGGIIE